MDPQIVLNLDPKAFESLIEQVVEQTLARLDQRQVCQEKMGEQILFNEKQAASLLGLTPIALKEERLKGRIENLRHGRRVAYTREQLDAYVDSWSRRNVRE